MVPHLPVYRGVADGVGRSLHQVGSTQGFSCGARTVHQAAVHVAGGPVGFPSGDLLRRRLPGANERGERRNTDMHHPYSAPMTGQSPLADAFGGRLSGGAYVCRDADGGGSADDGDGDTSSRRGPDAPSRLVGSADQSDGSATRSRSSATREDVIPVSSGETGANLDGQTARKRGRRRRSGTQHKRDKAGTKKQQKKKIKATRVGGPPFKEDDKDDGKDGGRFTAFVRLFLVQRWAAFVRKQLSREGVNLQLSVKTAAKYIQLRHAKKNGIPHKIQAIQGVLDQVLKFMQARQDAEPTGSGTVDVDELRSRMDDEKARAWRMTDDDMASLVETGEYRLSVTRLTKKTPVVTVGSARDSDKSDSSDQVDESGTSSATSSDTDDSHVGVLPSRVKPTVPPTARWGSSVTKTVARSSPGTTASAARSSRGASAGQDNPVVATASGRRGTSGHAASGRSSRAPPGGSADGAGDPFIKQLVSMVDAAPDKEREQLSVALAAVQMQAHAAARRDDAAATDAVKKA